MGDIIIIPNSHVKINKNTLFGFLKIVNASLERKAFKIKTTKPRDYLVKPSIGILRSKEEIIVEINLLENIKIDEQHKFAVEIYEINYRQTIDTLKRYLKSTQISPFLIKRLGVEFESVENSSTKQDYYIKIFCLIYLLILFVCIFLKLFNKVDA